MKPVVQDNEYGCGVACVAFLLRINYQKALGLFEDGAKKATGKGFYCREIVMTLKNRGLKFEYKYVKHKIRENIYVSDTIVFIKRSKKYPVGHYLVRTNKKWMDPWINFPRENIQAGFRRRLPGRPIYAIYPISDK